MISNNPIIAAAIQGTYIIDSYKKLTSKGIIEATAFNIYIAANEYRNPSLNSNVNEGTRANTINFAINLCVQEISQYVGNAEDLFNKRQILYHRNYIGFIKSKDIAASYYTNVLYHLFYINPLGIEPSDEDILLRADLFTSIEFIDVLQKDVLEIKKSISSLTITKAAPSPSSPIIQQKNIQTEHSANNIQFHTYNKYPIPNPLIDIPPVNNKNMPIQKLPDSSYYIHSYKESILSGTRKENGDFMTEGNLLSMCLLMFKSPGRLLFLILIIATISLICELIN